MPVLNKYASTLEGEITPVTLDGTTDTVEVSTSSKSTLYVSNATGGDLTLNVAGDTATSVTVAGLGSIDVSVGKSFTITDATTQSIPLNATYQDYLGDGNLTLTGGAGCTAYIVEG